MSLLVKKFGGSSLATVDHIQRIAQHILDEKSLGHDIVVVVSAMQGVTENLIKLASEISLTPNLREYDALLATGESASTALLSMALIAKSCPAVSLNARQLRILTNNQHKYAHIQTLELANLKRQLQAGKVPVITGFQGVNEFNEMTTLDRGGSDATAVALAYALQADECQIYTDVAGVYSADPRLLEVAKRIPSLSYEEMLQMADAGAKVMQKYSVELAAQHQVPLRVKSSFEEGEGTLLVNEEHCQFNAQAVQAVTSQDGLALLRFSAPSPAHELSQVVAILLNKSIKIQHISQQYYSHGLSLNLVVSEADFVVVKAFLAQCLHSWPHMQFSYELARAEVAVVGHALDNRVYVEIQSLLQQLGIVPDLVFSSPLKISLIFNQKSIKSLVSMLHQHLTVFK